MVAFMGQKLRVMQQTSQQRKRRRIDTGNPKRIAGATGHWCLGSQCSQCTLTFPAMQEFQTICINSNMYMGPTGEGHDESGLHEPPQQPQSRK